MPLHCARGDLLARQRGSTRGGDAVIPPRDGGAGRHGPNHAIPWQDTRWCYPVSPPGTVLEPRARHYFQGEISRDRIARPGKERLHVLPKSAAALQHFNPPARLLHICAWSSIYTVPLQLSFPSLPPLTQSCEHHCCSCLLLCSSARVAPLCRRHYQIKQ